MKARRRTIETPEPTRGEVILEIAIHVLFGVLFVIVLHFAAGCAEPAPNSPDAQAAPAVQCDICPVNDPEYRIVCNSGCAGALSACVCVGPDRWAPCGVCAP